MKKININVIINLFFLFIILILRYLQIYSIIPIKQLGKFILITIVVYFLIILVRIIKKLRNDKA